MKSGWSRWILLGQIAKINYTTISCKSMNYRKEKRSPRICLVRKTSRKVFSAKTWNMLIRGVSECTTIMSLLSSSWLNSYVLTDPSQNISKQCYILSWMTYPKATCSNWVWNTTSQKRSNPKSVRQNGTSRMMLFKRHSLGSEMRGKKYWRTNMKRRLGRIIIWRIWSCWIRWIRGIWRMRRWRWVWRRIRLCLRGCWSWSRGNWFSIWQYSSRAI